MPGIQAGRHFIPAWGAAKSSLRPRCGRRDGEEEAHRPDTLASFQLWVPRARDCLELGKKKKCAVNASLMTEFIACDGTLRL